MAVTQAQLTTAVNAATSESETAVSLSDPIRRALYRMSLEAAWPCLAAEDTSQSLADEEYTLDVPSDLTFLRDIKLNDGSDDYQLRPIELDEYNIIMSDTSVVPTGAPKGYIRVANEYLVCEAADGDYTAKIRYWKTHPYVDEDTTILFPDIFYLALAPLTIAYYLESKQMQGDQFYASQIGRYTIELAGLKGIAENPVAICSYGGL